VKARGVRAHRPLLAASPGEQRSSTLAALFLALAVLFLELAACGGGAPLLHGAHALAPGVVSIGGGLSGQVALKPIAQGPAVSPTQDVSLQELGVAPGVAPWAGGRMGVQGDNDFGITYAGRTLRLDGRHSFGIGKRGAISLGLGASAIMARRPSDGGAVSGVYGAGADVPLLVGWRSASDIYSLWLGPRGGFEILGGNLHFGETTAAASPETLAVYDVHARHFYGMLVAGLRVGFRHVHVAIELDAAYHHVTGTFQLQGGPKTSTSVQQISLTPAGALQVSF
jgi:hypothetical protein